MGWSRIGTADLTRSITHTIYENEDGALLARAPDGTQYAFDPRKYQAIHGKELKEAVSVLLKAPVASVKRRAVTQTATPPTTPDRFGDSASLGLSAAYERLPRSHRIIETTRAPPSARNSQVVLTDAPPRVTRGTLVAVGVSQCIAVIMLARSSGNEILQGMAHCSHGALLTQERARGVLETLRREMLKEGAQGIQTYLAGGDDSSVHDANNLLAYAKDYNIVGAKLLLSSQHGMLESVDVVVHHGIVSCHYDPDHSAASRIPFI